MCLKFECPTIRMEGALSSEEVYDTEVSPLVKQIIELCKSVEPNIPIAACSTFASEESTSGEGSCCSAIVPEHASPRMRYIASVCRNSGKPPMALVAQLNLGEKTAKELDGTWYKGSKAHTAAGKKILTLLGRVERLVNVTHHFPTAIVVQVPRKNRYKVVGQWPSQVYDGIQFMRVIAQHGFGDEAVKLLTSGEPGMGDFILRMRNMSKNLGIARTIGVVGDVNPRKKKKRRTPK